MFKHRSVFIGYFEALCDKRMPTTKERNACELVTFVFGLSTNTRVVHDLEFFANYKISRCFGFEKLIMDLWFFLPVRRQTHEWKGHDRWNNCQVNLHVTLLHFYKSIYWIDIYMYSKLHLGTSRPNLGTKCSGTKMVGNKVTRFRLK